MEVIYRKHNLINLKKMKKKLNKIFIDIYGLQDEISPDVDDEDITIRKANKKETLNLYFICSWMYFG